MRLAAEERGSPSGPQGWDFDTLYESYFDFVWRNVAHRRVPRALVDDVVQEVFLVVHRKLPEFEGRSSVRTWLAAIIRRVVKDQVKKKSHLPSGDALVDEPPSFALSPAEALERKQAVELLDRILDKMNEDQREVFILLELEGMSGKEIAEAINANENTVWTRVRAARAIFNAALAREKANQVWRERE